MATRADARQLVHVLDGYKLATEITRTRVVQHTSGLWTSMGSWRGPDVHRFVGQVVPVVKAGKRQMASLTDAYLAAVAKIATGTGQPLGVPAATLDDTRGGVPLEDVYARPGVTTWTAVAGGASWADAMRIGLNRLQGMVATDLQLAKTHTAREVFANDQRVTGFLRVTSGACCELCDLASDQTYHSDDLMPIHNNCNCDVEPLYADGGAPADLSTGHVEEDQGDTPDVRMHGELGPVLTVKGQNFTGPDDLAA